MSATADTDVLIVGGGLVGLATAAFLAQHGVRTTLVEQRDDTSRHPKARLVTVRSMELYRALGVESEVLAAGEPNGGFALADTLADDHETWINPPADEVGASDLSPCRPYSCDQQRLEPILRRRAARLGADIRFATRATYLDTSDNVRFRLDAPLGSARTRARYAVASDGARSPLRAALGIGMHGEPVDGSAVSALFRADLTEALRDRHVDAIMCRSAGAFLFARGNLAERTWQVGTYVRPDWDVTDDAALDGHIRAVIRTATGLPSVEPQVLSVQTWSTGAYVAEGYRHGPVFLVGDAAHLMPPYGGFGGTTGVADAHNLAWKLAHVCRGYAPDSLLDTYDTERRPLGASSTRSTRHSTPPSSETPTYPAATSPRHIERCGSPVTESIHTTSPAGTASTRADTPPSGQTGSSTTLNAPVEDVETERITTNQGVPENP